MSASRIRKAAAAREAMPPPIRKARDSFLAVEAII
jgi:hypothetical protein